MVHTERLQFQTAGDGDIIDITEEVAGCVRQSGLVDGIATLFVPGSTAGLTTVEYEPGLVEDLQELFERIAPRGRSYHHDLRWGDGNGYSHVRASLLGPSLDSALRRRRADARHVATDHFDRYGQSLAPARDRGATDGRVIVCFYDESLAAAAGRERNGLPATQKRQSRSLAT